MSRVQRALTLNPCFQEDTQACNCLMLSSSETAYLCPQVLYQLWGRVVLWDKVRRFQGLLAASLSFNLPSILGLLEAL